MFGRIFERRTFSAQCSKRGVEQPLLTGCSSLRSSASMYDVQMSLKLLVLASIPIDRYRARTPATVRGALAVLQPAASTVALHIASSILARARQDATFRFSPRRASLVS